MPRLDVFLGICRSLGVPIAEDKTEGPSTSLVFLGIEIDSAAMTVRLPADKLAKARTLITEWSARRKCTKRELLSLIGFLSFACKVVKPGRIFLRRLIDLSTSVVSLNHFIYLNAEARGLTSSSGRTFSLSGTVSRLSNPHRLAPSTSTSLLTRLTWDLAGSLVSTGFPRPGQKPGPPPRPITSTSGNSSRSGSPFTCGGTRGLIQQLLSTPTTSQWSMSGSPGPARTMMAIIRALFFRCAQITLNLLVAHVCWKRENCVKTLR